MDNKRETRIVVGLRMPYSLLKEPRDGVRQRPIIKLPHPSLPYQGARLVQSHISEVIVACCQECCDMPPASYKRCKTTLSSDSPDITDKSSLVLTTVPSTLQSVAPCVPNSVLFPMTRHVADAEVP